MSVEKPLFSISPLLYDALSGEFAPSADTRRHTLGRLVAATAIKGEYEFMEYKEWANNYGIYTYNPSWAPRTLSRVESCAVAENHVVMSSLHLKHENESHSLSIVSSLGKYSEALTISQAGVATTYELELGSKLHVARAAVTAAAEAFFSAN